MIFFQDDTGFSLNSIPFKSSEEFNTGLWLVLVGVSETPPHIALISGSNYYSLSTRKVDCGSLLGRFINTIERKKVPTVFIKIAILPQTPKGALNSPTQSPFRGLGQDKSKQKLNLEGFYKNLQPLVNSENTCLSPIKDFFAEYYSKEFASVNYVFELLALAQKKDLIQKCISLFCGDSNSNIVTLPKYTMAQIRNKIQEISSQITS